MIHVVNFPFCNFYSLERYLRIRGKDYRILLPESKLQSTDVILLPGVGTFGQAMHYLNQYGLTSLIRQHVESGGRLLGICLGLQLLFEASQESPGVAGLSLIPGRCEPIPCAANFRVPHIGWNQLQLPLNSKSAFSQFSGPDGLSIADFYFVHSYVAKPKHPSVITAFFEHPSSLLCAAVSMANIAGVQFHPEKSGKDGYLLLDQLLASASQS